MSKLLCKMIPSSCSIENNSTNHEKLTGYDVSGALSYLKLSDFETRFIRARFLLAETFEVGSPLWVLTESFGRELADVRSWQPITTQKAALVAVKERIDCEFSRCKRCDGTGIGASKYGGVTACGACDGLVQDENTDKLLGNGRRHISDREYARWLGIHHTTFGSLWSGRLIQIHALLIEIEIKARDLSAQLND